MTIEVPDFTQAGDLSKQLQLLIEALRELQAATTALEDNDVIQDAAIADHEARITTLEP